MNSHALQSDKVATLEQFVAKSVITASSCSGHNKVLLTFGFQMKMFMDVSHTLEMAICVVNQLKNDSYC